MTAEKILQLARSQLGVKESPANSNRVKYNAAYYGREVSGSDYAWCAVFVWWCFREAGASGLYYGGKKTAYCPALMSYHKAQAVSGDYQPGDVVFFNFKGKKNAAHVGICESWDGKYITTIDGNTGSGDQANGGAVLRQRRDKKYIVGAYRPQYRREEPDLTEEQVKKIAQEAAKTVCAEQNKQDYASFKAFMERYRKELGQLPAPDWGRTELELARAAGITDGSRPMDLMTRQEGASMVMRAIRKKG